MLKSIKSKDLHSTVISHIVTLMQNNKYQIEEVYPDLKCDLILRKEKIVYLIELKIGDESNWLPYGFYSALIMLKQQAENHFVKQQVMIDLVLVTNQKISWHMMRLLAPNVYPIIIQFHAGKPQDIAREVTEKLLVNTLRTIKIVDESFKHLRTAGNVNEKLKSLQRVGQLVEPLDEKQIGYIIHHTCNDPHPAIRGELAYLIGRSTKSDKLKILQNLKKDKNKYVHEQAFKALERVSDQVESKE